MALEAFLADLCEMLLLFFALENFLKMFMRITEMPDWKCK